MVSIRFQDVVLGRLVGGFRRVHWALASSGMTPLGMRRDASVFVATLCIAIPRGADGCASAWEVTLAETRR